MSKNQYTIQLTDVCCFNAENSVLLLKNLNLEIDPGSIVAVYSVNPEETKAFLRVVSKQQNPTHGKIDWIAQGVNKNKQKQPAVVSASFFENDYFPELQLIDNLYLGRHEFNLKKIFKPSMLVDHAEKLYSEFDCNQSLLSPGDLLSHEQRANASLIRGYITNADGYIFDHVISALLPNVLEKFIIKSSDASRQGCSTLFSVEKLSEDLSFVSHILILNEGAQVYYGSIKSLTDGQIRCIAANRITAFRDTVITVMEDISRSSDNIEFFVESMLEFICRLNTDSSAFVCYNNSENNNKVIENGLALTLDEISKIEVLMNGKNSIEQKFIDVSGKRYQLTPLFHHSPFKVSASIDYLAIAEDFADEKKIQVLIEEFEYFYTKFIREINLKELQNQGNRLDLLGTLAGEIVHDLNNSLFAIMGSIQLIKLKNSDAALNQHINVISDVVASTQSLSNKLLSFSKKGLTEFRNLSVHDLLDNAMMVVRSTSSKKCRINNIYHGAEFIVNGDEKELQNAFLNILLNSVEAVSSDDGKVQIETFNFTNSNDEVGVDGRLLPEEAVGISVADNGRGISEEIIKNIFDPFFTTSHDENDSGLGLAIAYGSIKEHKGNITVQSDADVGTQFKIYLPLKEVAQIHELESQEKIQAIRSPKTKSILICDDNENVRRVMATMLKSLKYDVLMANDAAQCLEKYRENINDVALIILDDIMPNMTGRECFYELKKINNNIKVVIITGYRQTNYPEKIFKDGLLDLLRKPISIEQLSDCLRRCLN